MLPPGAFKQPRVTAASLMSRFEFVDSDLGDIVDEMEEETEEFEDEISESILDEEIMEEEEEQLEEIVSDIHLINYQQQGLNQTSGRRSMTARMRVNTNYTHYRIQVPQQILDEIEDEEEEEEEVVVEDDMNEFMDQDMSEYFETRTYYAPPAMDTDGGDEEEEEQEACAICLLEYRDEDTIATLG